jgi:4-aminobutyrate aminotransferase-like enzyme
MKARRCVLDRLIAEKLMADERVKKAREMLLGAVREHSAGLTGIRAADSERKAGYDALIKEFEAERAGPLFYPLLGSGVGRGALVELADGSVKYDMITGIGVHFFGHSHPGLMEAVINGALGDTVMQGNLQQNVESAALARELIELAGDASGLKHCFLTTSGAMANENALKLLFQKHAGTERILAFEHAFAGRTLALSQITDKPAYRVGLPTVLAVDYVPFFDAGRPEESIEAAVKAVRAHVARHPGRYAGMWMELVQGEGGYYPGSTAFFKAVIGELRKAGLGVVVDEVQTFGRTQSVFAFQHFGLAGLVDIVTVGKCLQVCATLFSDAYKAGPGLISQTFTGATSSLHAARWIVARFKEPGLYGPGGRVMEVHGRFVRRFEEIAVRHPGWVNGPFGIGGMVAFTPLNGEEKQVKALLARMYEEGVIAFVAGSGPSRVRFLPAVPVIQDEEIDGVCAVLENSLGVVARG